MIELDNISYKINDKAILDNISCKMEDNTLTAIIGPNGSGKSTLLKCIMKFVNYKGEVLVDKNSSLKGSELARQVTYFSQVHNIMFPHTVFNMILMGRRPNAPYFYSSEDKNLTKRCIEEMNLSGFSESPVTSLSGGEQQKTFFARSLVQDTKNMLLDEPFNNLDPYYQVDITRKLIKLKNKKTIVVVLHDIGMIRYFNRVIMIKNGKIMENILIHELNCELLKRLFDIDFVEYYRNEDKIYIPLA